MTETTVWYCDTCGDEIWDSTKGLLVWDYDHGINSNFELVHQGPRCDTDRSQYTQHIDHMLGVDGQAKLFALLADGPLRNESDRVGIKNFSAFLDVYRRLQTPGYEEARRYFGNSEVQDNWSDANEYAPYTAHGISRTIEIGRAANQI